MPSFHGSRRTAGIGMLLLSLVCPAGAQTLPAVPPSDYGRWERLDVPDPLETTPLSPDGRWLAYRIQRSNGESELCVAVVAGEALAAGEGTRSQSIPFGEQPVFSADSLWMAYVIGLSEAESWSAEANDSNRLSAAFATVVRTLLERRAGASLDHGGEERA